MTTPIDRDDAAAAGAFVERLLPDSAVRSTVLSFAAQSILAAHEAGPSSWNVSIWRGNSVLLNVSHCSLISIAQNLFELCVHGDHVNDELAGILGDRLSTTRLFKSLPPARVVTLRYDELDNMLPRLERAHLALIAAAGPMFKIAPNARGHRSGLVNFISEQTGIELPDPEYVDRASVASAVSPASRFEELASLYADFATEFAPTDAGRAHAASYAGGRATAAVNFQEVCQAADAGEAIVDRVLLHLLPHAKTKGNLARGAWIHVAPAITKDAKALFEGAGWAQPEEWPAIASELLAFVRRCVDSPEQLGDAVAGFSRKGFQAGMVTPILNALRPDAFLISNRKSCALVSYLSGTKYTTSLAGYPALNTAGFADIARFREVFAVHDRPEGITDSDLFDMFGHWLFTIRKFAFGKKPAMATGGVTTSWLFQCNPKTYDLRAALRELPAIPWVVRQHKSDIAEGHTVFMWEAGRNAGILARGIVGAPPLSGLDRSVDAKFVLTEGQFKDTELYVPVEIEHVYRPPVSRALLRRHARLGGIQILKISQGTNFPVTDDETEALLELEAPPDARFWSIAVESKRWAAYRDGGFVAAAWPNVGDISAMTREELDRALDTVAEGNPGDYSTPGASQMWTFASIRPGDRVVASGGADLALGIGTVVGPYSFDASPPHAHRLAVRWDDVQARRHASDTKWKHLVVEMSPEEFDGIAGTPPVDDAFKADDPVDVETAASDALEVVAIDENIVPVVPPEPNKLILIEDVASKTNFDVELLERWVRAIQRKGQAVLYGPPGTGKTYVAEWLARHLAGGGFGTIETVQFHPAYSYEEFMAGIRPRTRPDGSLEYALEDGFFVRFCDLARTLDGTSVLIIDELNRANLPRVFGELMYLLEYRDNDVAIAGSRRFSIPDNVRIIGTMNTADRSIALVDHALRRRFAFLGLLPNHDVLRNRHANTSGIDVEGLIGVLEKLNSAIADPHYEVGISFFCGPDLAASIGDIWEMEIEPYIEEYFFDRRSVFTEFRWTKVRDAILGPGGGAR